MKLLIKIFVVLISGIIGLYLGGRYGIYLTENNIVDLGAPAGNLLYPFFWIIMAIIGGILSVITGLITVIIISKFHKRNKDKKLTNNFN
jgi:hypothetical protein